MKKSNLLVTVVSMLLLVSPVFSQQGKPAPKTKTEEKPAPKPKAPTPVTYDKKEQKPVEWSKGV